MDINSHAVALLPSRHYLRQEIKAAVARICEAVQFKITAGARVLLKPNLLTARSSEHLACTHPEFVAAVAEWCVEHGAVVTIGDSPAFGTARGVMHATGIANALAGLPVEQVNFDHSVSVRLAGGVKVNMARAALECDVLINLPRLKAHSQLYMTLAVKNYFGTVIGFQKPCWHLRYGNREDRFASHLVDLLTVLPAGMSIIDGIVAMHGTGPVSGQAYPLGLIGGARNPVALDTALLHVLGLVHKTSVIWQECAKRGLAGSDPDKLHYTLVQPEDFKVEKFKAPLILKPVSFNPLRMLVSGCRRFTARLKESP